jgi:hypothetical protein
MRAVRALLAVIGVMAALGLCAWGGVLVYDAIDALTDGARIGETRTPIPGRTDVPLDEGKYVVFYEIATTSVPDVDDSSIPSFELVIRRDGDGPPLPLKGYGSDFTVESGGRTGRARYTVQIPTDGRYRITASGNPEGAQPAVVLGKPVTRRVLRLVLGAVAFIAGLALGILVIAIAAGLAIRDRHKPA